MKNVEITMPICPERVAVMTHRPNVSGYFKVNAAQINEINRRTVAFADEQFVSRREEILPFWFEPGIPQPDAWREPCARDGVAPSI
ncbi:MAG: hypothetical protein JWN34_1382 [Bryobacterales bacterium]|jgi:hypothetical protein|nr:hypothetical protein [Bryobacterales bacterium]